MTDLLDQIYTNNSKNVRPTPTNVNNSVGTDSIRLSNVSGFSTIDNKTVDYSNRVSYVGTYEKEKKTKVTLQFEPWEL